MFLLLLLLLCFNITIAAVTGNSENYFCPAIGLYLYFDLITSQLLKRGELYIASVRSLKFVANLFFFSKNVSLVLYSICEIFS